MRRVAPPPDGSSTSSTTGAVRSRVSWMAALRRREWMKSSRLPPSSPSDMPNRVRAARLLARMLPSSSRRISPSSMQSRIRLTLSRSAVMEPM